MSVIFQKQMLFKAVTVKYVGCTTHRPARLIARSGKIRRVYSYDQFPGNPYKYAVDAFCKDVGWSGTMAGGQLSEDVQVYVFVD